MIVIANNSILLVCMRHAQAGGYVTPFFVVGGVCIIFAVPLFLLNSKIPCKYDINALHQEYIIEREGVSYSSIVQCNSC